MLGVGVVILANSHRLKVLSFPCRFFVVLFVCPRAAGAS